jgi:signal peptidase I
MPCQPKNPYLSVILQAIQERGYARTAFCGKSMQPALFEGMQLLVERSTSKTIKTADIICYKRGEQMVVHRVIRILHRDKTITFMTKGDNQGYMGVDYVEERDLIGRVHAAFFKERPEENVLIHNKFNPSQKSPGFNPRDECFFGISAQEGATDFSPWGSTKFSYAAIGILVSFILFAKRYLPKPVRRMFGPFVDVYTAKTQKDQRTRKKK